MSESKNPKFDRAFAAARKKFKKTGDANDYTFYFKGEGREGRFTVNLKGETKKDLMAKFAPGSKNTGANYKVKGKSKVRPKLRPKSTEPGELTPGQKDAQALVYKKYGGKPAEVASGKQHLRSKVDTSRKVGELSATGKATVATVKQDDRSEKNLNRNFTLRQQQASNATLKVFYALTSKQKLNVGKLIRKEGLTLSAAIKKIKGFTKVKL